MSGALPRLDESAPRVRAHVTQRLDALETLLPVQREKLPFDQYLLRAQAVAARDPQFARQLASALAQYRAVAGAQGAK